METKNDVTIKGKGKLSLFLMRITCSRLVKGAAKKHTVITQQTTPEFLK